MTSQKHPLRLNVGFIVAEQIGYKREFPIEIPEIRLQELELRDLNGSVTVTRSKQGLLVEVVLTGTTSTDCMRCLEPVELTLSPNFTELYAFSKTPDAESILKYPETGIIDLGPLVREYMLLEIPIKPLCQPDCLGLCPVCGENQNEHVCVHEEEVIDPRFDVLRSLLQSGKPT
jgi:uncharacterized protein